MVQPINYYERTWCKDHTIVNSFGLAFILTKSSFPDSVGVALCCSYDIEDLLNGVLIF
jgi:hypothetical protein